MTAPTTTAAATAVLPAGPAHADDEFARTSAWVHDRPAYRAARCDAVVADVVAEYYRAVTAATAARSATDQCAKTVRAHSDAFDVIDRRSGRSSELAATILAEEYDRLCALSDVASVTVTEQAIVVTTTDLIISIGAQRWDIGPYRVHLPRDGGAASVRIESIRGNLSRTYNASHPHVYQNICWGNLS